MADRRERDRERGRDGSAGGGVGPHLGRAVAAVLAALVLAGCGAGEDEPAAPTGPLTVEQALALDSDEPVTVRGSLLVDAAGEARLCAALAESYPPQCGGPSLVVEGLAPHALPPLRRAQDVAWSERPVDLRGIVFDGSLRVLERGG